MSVSPVAAGQIKAVVPFLRVSSMERSLRYYVDGLGFTMQHSWVVEGQVRWCWLAAGGAALMLQQSAEAGPEANPPVAHIGQRGTLSFMCEDALALYGQLRARDIQASEPEVGNGLWVTGLSDPDGYVLEFESPTDTPEDTKLSDVTG